MSSSVGMILPHIWKNNTCLKPPTSFEHVGVNSIMLWLIACLQVVLYLPTHPPEQINRLLYQQCMSKYTANTSIIKISRIYILRFYMITVNMRHSSHNNSNLIVTQGPWGHWPDWEDLLRFRGTFHCFFFWLAGWPKAKHGKNQVNSIIISLAEWWTIANLKSMPTTKRLKASKKHLLYTGLGTV